VTAPTLASYVAIGLGAAVVIVGLFRGESTYIAAGAGLLGGPAVLGKGSK
jgi:hypothetical protein